MFQFNWSMTDSSEIRWRGTHWRSNSTNSLNGRLVEDSYKLRQLKNRSIDNLATKKFLLSLSRISSWPPTKNLFAQPKDLFSRQEFSWLERMGSISARFDWANLDPALNWNLRILHETSSKQEILIQASVHPVEMFAKAHRSWFRDSRYTTSPTESRKRSIERARGLSHNGEQLIVIDSAEDYRDEKRGGCWVVTGSTTSGGSTELFRTYT